MPSVARKCGLYSVATTNRGYSLLTGFIGSVVDEMYAKSAVISGNQGSKSNTIGDDKMEFKKCPNCGLVYNERDRYYCVKCNIRLKPASEVNKCYKPRIVRCIR